MTPCLLHFHNVEHSKVFLNAYEFYTTGAGCQYGSTVKARRCKPFYSSSWKGGNHGTHDQLALWGWIKLPCDPHRRHRLPPATLWTSPVRHSCRGTSLWTRGRRSAAPPGPENVPSLQHRLRGAHSVTVDWRRLPRGFRPPTAAARLVNRSNVGQISRVRRGLDLRRVAHVSCCLPCRASPGSQRSTKKGGKKPVRTRETGHRIDKYKGRNVQGDPFVQRDFERLIYKASNR